MMRWFLLSMALASALLGLAGAIIGVDDDFRRHMLLAALLWIVLYELHMIRQTLKKEGEK